MIEYFLKYKSDDTVNTALEHIKVLQKNGQVLWGQWSTQLLAKSRYDRLNKQPFIFYALGNYLLKMHCIKVLRKEEVVSERLEGLIPSYYNVNTPVKAFFLIDKIEVFLTDEGEKIIGSNGNSILKANQVIGWEVETLSELENPLDYSELESNIGDVDAEDNSHQKQNTTTSISEFGFRGFSNTLTDSTFKLNAEGLIYIILNEGFKSLKIGYTTDLKARLRSLETSVPDPFHVYAIYKTKANLADKKVHNLIDTLNPALRHNKNKEYYDVEPDAIFKVFECIAQLHGDDNNLIWNPLKDDYIEKNYMRH